MTDQNIARHETEQEKAFIAETFSLSTVFEVTPTEMAQFALRALDTALLVADELANAATPPALGTCEHALYAAYLALNSPSYREWGWQRNFTRTAVLHAFFAVIAPKIQRREEAVRFIHRLGAQHAMYGV